MSGLKASQELMSKWRSAIRGDKKNDTGVSCDDGTEGEVQLDVIVAQINLVEETVESTTSMKYPRETYNETEKQTNESRLAYVRKLMPAEDEKACYVLMRVAVEDQLGDVDRARESWLFIYSVPNRLSVRERMLYSSSLQGMETESKKERDRDEDNLLLLYQSERIEQCSLPLSICDAITRRF